MYPRFLDALSPQTLARLDHVALILRCVGPALMLLGALALALRGTR
jgi:hypothetical protein